MIITLLPEAATSNRWASTLSELPGGSILGTFGLALSKAVGTAVPEERMPLYGYWFSWNRHYRIPDMRHALQHNAIILFHNLIRLIMRSIYI